MGSVRHLVNPAGTPLLSQSYDPFGNVLQQGGSGQSTFGYTGEQTDPTGLVYLRARYYDPSVGRFLTADSLIPDPLSSGGWNRYAYVENNPVRFVDPSGHQGGECVQLGLQDPAMCIPQGGGARGGLGSSSGSGGLGRGAIIRAGIGGAVIGGTRAAVNNMALDPEVPQVPTGVDLNETPIIPCFEPGIGLGGVGDILPPVLSTPLDASSFPIFSGTPLNPGIEWPNFLESTTRRGIKRDNPGYFKRLLKQNPDILGEASKEELKAGRMPFVDENWIKYFPEHAPYLGDVKK